MIKNLKNNYTAWLRYGIFSLFIIAIFTYVFHRLGYQFTYQETNSMPKGLYFIEPKTEYKRGDFVLFDVNKKMKRYMIQHHWIGPNMPLLKQVKAIPGDSVCIRNQSIYINYHPMGPVFAEYKPHHLLPHLKLCGILEANQYMLMSTFVTRSFDSRYFGPINKSQIIGKAILL